MKAKHLVSFVAREDSAIAETVWVPLDYLMPSIAEETGGTTPPRQL